MKRAGASHCYGVTDTAVEWGRSTGARIIGLCLGVLRLSVSVRGMITRRGAPNFLSKLSNMLDSRGEARHYREWGF